MDASSMTIFNLLRRVRYSQEGDTSAGEAGNNEAHTCHARASSSNQAYLR